MPSQIVACFMSLVLSFLYSLFFNTRHRTHSKKCLEVFVCHRYDASLKIVMHLLLSLLRVCVFLRKGSHKERFRGLSCDCA